MNTHNSHNREKLLFKLILQFAFYLRGSNSELDPHLLSISRKLRAGNNYAELDAELHELSNTLKNLTRISNNICSHDFEAQQRFDHEALVARLYDLLDETQFPIQFHNECLLLKQKFSADMSSDDYQDLIEASIDLLHSIRNHAVEEQNDINDFLNHIPEHLAYLETQAQKFSESSNQSYLNREQLSTHIDQQVINIESVVLNAKSELPLQDDLRSYLNTLKKEFAKHKQSEDSLHSETERQLLLMTEKLIQMNHEVESLQKRLSRVHTQAIHDCLTQLPNRTAYNDRIIFEYKRWLRYKTPLALLIWDIDHFKSINDRYGHKAGDKTLQIVAQLILKNCRQTDFVSRFGGEEFVMLLPSTTAEQALIYGNNIRQIIAGTRFSHNGESVNLTISCGIDEFSGTDTPDDVFERADQALYKAKSQGRNQCIVAT